MGSRRHTTLNLDMELVEKAQSVLGTSQTTETIHRALQEAVDLDKRRQLLDMGIGDLTPERLEEMRRVRSFDSSDAPESA
jgi:Arc/MetJ family transcription regulator